MQVNVLEAKNRLSQLIKAAQAGEEVVIANRGEPVVRLVPVRKGDVEELPPGSPERIRRWFENNPLPESSRRSAEQIEADIEAERNGWE
ncbi:MAG TPA: type II toxin-antitoxin system prevent-host-death family antitoxin [Rhizomicrobium sp.]|nr:type II toxin-antitoxin system prevent-host-death family antitoxin [Rhizomicrobium sp.]